MQKLPLFPCILLRNEGKKVDPLGRRLRVTVLECKDLPKMDRIGQNDVFLAVHVDGEVLKTSVAEDGGKAPRWNSGAGDTLLFTPRGGDPETLLVRAFDKDKTADELIGTYADTLLSIRPTKPNDEDWSVCEWYPLTNTKGEDVGEVRLFLRWDKPPAARIQEEVTVPGTHVVGFSLFFSDFQ